ncbi:MAG TPA: gephyrin-like molybdotransferase Glp [Solirubrobacteraceae bacterium]|nr:gephyrin-like molybdotransferase Glp [Solirubrobacteraceae bacterium]
MPSALLEIDRARELVLESAPLLDEETVALDEALGRVLSRELSSTVAVPAFDSSAMDGFAVRSGDLVAARADAPVALELVGESRAGHPVGRPVGPLQAAAISTGAAIPPGADAVVALERVGSGDGHIHLREPVPAGNDIRRSGEDIRPGTAVLSAGRRLGPAAVGVAASLGLASIGCRRRPLVSVIATGDELLEPGSEPRAGAIYNSNGHAVPALARSAGALTSEAGTVGDDPHDTRRVIAGALGACDVLVLCGGVSVGPHDHVRETLAQLGAEERFWGIALKPGKPTWFGTCGQQLVFGLPGNPVSAMVTFVLLVAPALRAMMGARRVRHEARGILAGEYRKPAGRAHAVRCRLDPGEGGLRATPTGHQGSHVLSAMLDADALAIVPSAAERVAAGEPVELELLNEQGTCP